MDDTKGIPAEPPVGMIVWWESPWQPKGPSRYTHHVTVAARLPVGWMGGDNGRDAYQYGEWEVAGDDDTHTWVGLIKLYGSPTGFTYIPPRTASGA